MSDNNSLKEKTASIGGLLTEVASHATNLGAITAAASIGGLALKRLTDKINNDTRRKALIEDLAMHDPVLKSVDKVQLLEWYATIYNVAPTISVDKSAVREVLQNFARFGRADLQTLKMLAETEKAMVAQHVDNSWAGILTGAVR